MTRSAVSLATSVGTMSLRSAVMTASGTSGHGAELAAYGDLAELGAVVVKSVSPDPWPGNPAPRLHPLRVGMLNSVGLQGPGISSWAQTELAGLRAHGATVVLSVWGRTIEEYARAAELVAELDIDAVEINVSCPNLEDRSRMFAHSPEATAAVVQAMEMTHPRWVKLSPNTAELVDVARSACDAGADAVVLTNTVLGMAIDLEERRPALGGGGGGLSGPAIHAVAVRAIFECAAAIPGIEIVGVGGVSSGLDAIEMIMAGASAIQVGTASLAEPRAPWRIGREMRRWMERHDVANISELRGAVHG